jgi:hypothetical protein
MCVLLLACMHTHVHPWVLFNEQACFPIQACVHTHICPPRSSHSKAQHMYVYTLRSGLCIQNTAPIIHSCMHKEACAVSESQLPIPVHCAQSCVCTCEHVGLLSECHKCDYLQALNRQASSTFSDLHQACTHLQQYAPLCTRLPPACSSTFRPRVLSHLTTSVHAYLQWAHHSPPTAAPLMPAPQTSMPTNRHVPPTPNSHMWMESEPRHVETRLLCGAAFPSPRLSGVLGTAGTVPTHRNRHSRRIASAANFSSAVK